MKTGGKGVRERVMAAYRYGSYAWTNRLVLLIIVTEWSKRVHSFGCWHHCME